jgi:methyl-accepting chemotaxis protein
MSDSQAYEEATVSSDGVTVTKRFEEDEFPVPAIAFEFESERDESVTVTMSDTVPDGIEVEDLGFHPEYGSEYWTIDDDTITFERDLEAAASYTTVYGIRATGSDDVQQFLTEPTLEEVDPPLPEEEKEDPDDVIPETDDDVVKDAISGDGEIPGLEEEGGDDVDEEDVETLNLADPNDSGAATAESTATDEEGDASGDAEATADAGDISADGSVTAAMAKEIREQNVSGDDVKLLRRAFELAEQEGGSTKARLQQIQSDISDLRAYTTALEEFLDENGTGAELIEEFETELDSFDERLSSFQSEIQQNSEQVEAVSEEVQSVSETVSTFDEEIESIGDDVEGVSEQVDDVSAEVDDVSAEVDDVSAEVDDVSEDVAEVGAEVDDVSEEISSVSSELDEFESAIEGLESDIATLEEQVTDDDVVGRLDSIEEEIEDLQTWQEQIKETFGG